jgi:uncharacterized membrane protein YqiK
MADQLRPDTQPAAKRAEPEGPQQPRPRETAEQRREKRTAVARDKQADLKREAAERRNRKNRS